MFLNPTLCRLQRLPRAGLISCTFKLPQTKRHILSPRQTAQPERRERGHTGAFPSGFRAGALEGFIAGAHDCPKGVLQPIDVHHQHVLNCCPMGHSQAHLPTAAFVDHVDTQTRGGVRQRVLDDLVAHVA